MIYQIDHKNNAFDSNKKIFPKLFSRGGGRAGPTPGLFSGGAKKLQKSDKQARKSKKKSKKM